MVKALLSDAAPQYKKLTEEQALCWIHDGRDYTKLVPVVPFHKKELQDFRSKYWAYYGKLLQFKLDPSQEKAEKLSAGFDALVSTKTNYETLNELIIKTKEGTQANDTFSTIVQTAKKLGVSAYAYFNDRMSKAFEMPSLAELIGKKAQGFVCKDNG